MTESVWVVADVLSEDGRMFEIIAVCDTERQADVLCTEPCHCIFPMQLNTPIYASITASGARYPRNEAGAD